MSDHQSPLLKRMRASSSSTSSSPDDGGVTPKKCVRDICTYGSACYRRNIHHLLEYSHLQLEETYEVMRLSGNFESLPEDTKVSDEKVFLQQISILKQAKFVVPSGLKNVERDSKASELLNKNDSEVKHHSFINKPQKRPRGESESEKDQIKIKTVLDKWNASAPYHYFLTSVSRISEEKEGVYSVGFRDLLDQSLGGPIKTLCHINFMIEANWFMEESLRAGVEGVPTWVICGVESVELQEVAATFPWIKLFGIKSPFPYGHHHTKMSIVQYSDLSVRFMVYTANLIDSDWENRTQGVWISPKCPRQEGREGGESVTNFKADFIQYLQSYPVKVAAAWVDVIRHVDCSSINVHFIASAPITAQSMSNGFQWGIKKMERVIKSVKKNGVEADWPLIVQCSSIGSLGPGPQDWLQGELGQCLGGKGRMEGPVYVVYPSHNNVKESFDGLHGGGCLPYSGSTHTRQTWLEKHLCQWKADCSGRTRAVPHIKSYCRISPDSTKLGWFLVTSANLSKAAWGKLSKKKDRLSVMSWEAGVLFTPEILIGKSEFDMGVGGKDNQFFPFHIDLPVTKYRADDKPWFFETLAALSR